MPTAQPIPFSFFEGLGNKLIISRNPLLRTSLGLLNLSYLVKSVFIFGSFLSYGGMFQAIMWEVKVFF